MGRAGSLDEQVFEETLKKIRWSTNRQDLYEATVSTLQLMLRRPTDSALLNKLLSQTHAIVSPLPDGSGKAQTAQVRQAAVRCVVLLQSAKKSRLTRTEDDEKVQNRKHRWVMALAAAVTATAALYLFIMPREEVNVSAEAMAKNIETAVTSSRLGLSQRGDITVRSTPEHVIVTAERLSPDDCLSVARKVQTLGVLTINSTMVDTGSNEDQLSTLCHEMTDASLTISHAQIRKR